MSKETFNNNGDSNDSQNQSINQEKILNSSKDSLDSKFDQLVIKIDELIASQKTLVEEQKKAVIAMNSSVEVMKSSLSNQNQLIQLIKELFTKGEKDENPKKEK